MLKIWVAQTAKHRFPADHVKAFCRNCCTQREGARAHSLAALAMTGYGQYWLGTYSDTHIAAAALSICGEFQSIHGATPEAEPPAYRKGGLPEIGLVH